MELGDEGEMGLGEGLFSRYIIPFILDLITNDQKGREETGYQS